MQRRRRRVDESYDMTFRSNPVRCSASVFSVLLLSFSAAGVWLVDSASGQKPVVRDPKRFIEKEVISWKTLRERHIVMQKRDFSCGAAALATVIRYYWGDPATEEQFIDAILNVLNEEETRDRVENGLSMTDLRKAAVDQGYLSSIGKVSLQQLVESKIPVIVRVDVRGYEHFVIVRGFVGDRVFLADPIRGNIRVPVEDFLDQWNEGKQQDGAILVIVKKGLGPQENAPLLIRRRSDLPLQPEMQAARRGLFEQNIQLPKLR